MPDEPPCPWLLDNAQLRLRLQQLPTPGGSSPRNQPNSSGSSGSSGSSSGNNNSSSGAEASGVNAEGQGQWREEWHASALQARTRYQDFAAEAIEVFGPHLKLREEDLMWALGQVSD